MFLVLLISMAATNVEPFVAGQALGPACLLAIEYVFTVFASVGLQRQTFTVSLTRR